MKVRCRRGHVKTKGKNCRICQSEWERRKYRDDPEYRDRKKTVVIERYWREAKGDQT